METTEMTTYVTIGVHVTKSFEDGVNERYEAVEIDLGDDGEPGLWGNTYVRDSEDGDWVTDHQAQEVAYELVEAALEGAWIAVIRDPDLSNEVTEIIGKVTTISVDLGADFNGTPENRQVAEEWARGLEAQAADAPEAVGEWVNSYLNEMFQEWGYWAGRTARDP